MKATRLPLRGKKVGSGQENQKPLTARTGNVSGSSSRESDSGENLLAPHASALAGLRHAPNRRIFYSIFDRVFRGCDQPGSSSLPESTLENAR